MCKVVAHIVADERAHRHRIATNYAYRTGCRRRRFARHNRAYEHAVVPVFALVNERSGLRSSSAEYDRRKRNAVRRFELIGKARAVDGRSGKSRIRVRAFNGLAVCVHRVAVPGISLPVERMLRRVFVEPFPPNRFVVEIFNDVGKYRALFRRK